MKRARRAILLAGLTLTTLCGCMGLAEEHKEARNLEIRDIDFSGLEAGVYHGAYDGGMKAWRRNQVEVRVGQGQVEAIDLVSSAELDRGDPHYQALVARVVEEQSLQIDVISGATLTSKAHLKAMELALLQAVPATEPAAAGSDHKGGD